MNNKAKICLNAMVGNESATILRMLESVAPHINFYVIQCNGKEDNTKQIIETFFEEKNVIFQKTHFLFLSKIYSVGRTYFVYTKELPDQTKVLSF